MIPLFVDCSDKLVVIFGGGNVAARKAAYFSGRSRLTVVSRSFVPEFNSVECTRVELDLDSISDLKLLDLIRYAFLVISAVSDPAVNNRIGRLCTAMQILFNNADGETGDVMLPAVTSGDNYTIAISTKGASPAVSRFIREQIEDEFPALDAMIALQERLRKELKEKEPDQAKRNSVLRNVLEDHTIWEKLVTDRDAAWQDVQRRYLHG
jgi:precorrin-2 dehydrogenase/sirohydrochlorin ferrochelatase